MQLFNKILTVMMLTFLAVFFLLFMILPHRDFSERENRMLQKKPALSRDNLISGKFSHAAEDYLTDHFVFRDTWVGLKSAAELILQKKDNNGVYFGRDGYLLQKPEKLNTAFLAANIAALNQFAATLPAPVYLLLVPTSAQVLDDKLPRFAAPQQNLDLFALIKKQLGPDIRLIDTYPALAAHKQEYIYYKTDHHWTSLGAYYAYREAGRVMDFPALDLNDFNLEPASDNFYGTLYSKSGHRFLQPDSIHLFHPKRELACQVDYINEQRTGNSLYAREHLLQKDQYAVFLDGNHALTRITTLKKTGRKLLIIKDSYANTLVPFLANHYDEIYLIDLRYFNAQLKPYLEQYGFKEILLIYNTLSLAEDSSLRKIGS
ncbi:MAG: hypothetical protein A4E56_01758 [Pelotomaculum sp. PtaU1.Bin065]|nr:MAG: hypothetical protein A4E56_01758 [Pelotomaculum sp. PtaU1.Bin065]